MGGGCLSSGGFIIKPLGPIVSSASPAGHQPQFSGSRDFNRGWILGRVADVDGPRWASLMASQGQSRGWPPPSSKHFRSEKKEEKKKKKETNYRCLSSLTICRVHGTKQLSINSCRGNPVAPYATCQEFLHLVRLCLDREAEAKLNEAGGTLAICKARLASP